MEITNESKKYRTDNKIVFSCQYHVICTPKYRRKIFKDKIEERLKELILEKQKEWKYEILEMEVMPDHIHLLIDINPKLGIYNVITKIKGYSSNILRGEFSSLCSRLPCLWTRSAFISTVGSVSLETVKQYIENQKNV